MTYYKTRFDEIRPGMEHLNFIVVVKKILEVRKVKTYSGIEHNILEGEIENSSGSIGFAVWNEKIEFFKEISVGDNIELLNCFITSFKGILQVNVGRDSDVRKIKI